MLNIIFIILNIILLYLILILISFDPSDPGWMQLQSSWNGSICNQGGIIGAQFADFLFFCCGSLTYTIPIIIFFYIWIFFIKKININFFQFCSVSIIILILFIFFYVLAQFLFKDVFYFSLGGIIGDILYDIISTNHNLPLYPIYILYYTGIISIIYFFPNFFLFYLKIIWEKTIYFLYIILSMIFFVKKNHRQYDVHQQANYNTRVSPSILSHQKNASSRNFILDPLKMDEKFNRISNILKQFKKQSQNNNDYLNNIKLIAPSTYDIVKQNKNTIQYWINRIKCNTTYPKHDFDNIYFINMLRFFNKKNIDKCMKKTQNSNIPLTILQKKITSDNKTSLYRSVIDDINIFNQAKTIFLKKNKSQTKSISKLDNHNIIMSIQKTSHNTNCIDITFPDINLLITHTQHNIIDSAKFKKISLLIEKKLFEYRVSAKVVTIISGPVITRFDLNLSAGTKSSKITNLSRDLARSLSVSSVRVLEIVPGTPYVGLEIPNEQRDIVCLKDIISSNKFQKNNSPLTLVLGKDVTGQPIVEDLRYMPHLLVAGTTGSGKSIGINVMIISILYKSTPEDVRFIMIDPKILELSIYANIPHLLKNVVTNTQDAESTLQWCVKEMEHRYKLMSTVGVRNLESYNHHIAQLNLQNDTINYSKKINHPKCDSNDIIFSSKKLEKLPYIVIIIDEFADLMITTTKKIEVLIIRLTQKARAAGIHMILATQRPSVDVITGVIKANIPTRIAFTVSSKIDSRTILDQSGAESLLGMGDMLYLPPNSSIPIRIHGANITDTEIYAVINFWKQQTTKYIHLDK